VWSRVGRRASATAARARSWVGGPAAVRAASAGVGIRGSVAVGVGYRGADSFDLPREYPAQRRTRRSGSGRPGPRSRRVRPSARITRTTSNASVGLGPPWTAEPTRSPFRANNPHNVERVGRAALPEVSVTPAPQLSQPDAHLRGSASRRQLPPRRAAGADGVAAAPRRYIAASTRPAVPNMGRFVGSASHLAAGADGVAARPTPLDVIRPSSPARPATPGPAKALS
jgi:hypothetical protein